MEKGSVVAVSTDGMRTEKDLFLAGYKETLHRINPKAVLCYGEPFEEMDGKLIVIDYAKTNNLSPKKFFSKPIIKGGGAAGDGSNGGQRPFPRFPGWDPAKCSGEGYKWCGHGEPGSKTGNWYNRDTKEWLRPELDHAEPIGPHWNYGIRKEDISYRIFPDNRYSPKEFGTEGATLK